MNEKTEYRKTREDVADIMGAITALMRKAECRAIDCGVLDAIDAAHKAVIHIDDMLTEIIGD